MSRTASLLAIGVAALVSGCGREPPRQHPLTLEFPAYDCRGQSGLCLTWIGCDRLGIHQFHFTVGPKHCEDTLFLCLWNSRALTMNVYYQPGQDYYLIKGWYERDGSRVETTAGPFSEDETQTPWKLTVPQ